MMKNRYRVPALLLFALVLTLAIGQTALAADPSFTSIKAVGEAWFTQNGVQSFAAFGAVATGPAAPGEDHQPAQGYLSYRDSNGLKFKVAVEHIHAHSTTEVHFGGVILQSSDPSLVGKHAHMVAIDNGRSGDQFSVLVTDGDMHEHGAPVTVDRGSIVVKL